MRRAALYSAALHVAVITVAYFGVPALFSKPPVEDQPLSVDLVTIEEVPRKAPPEPPKPAPPPPVAKPTPPPPPPPPTPAAAPEPPAPPPVAAPAPAPEPPPPPKARPKPKPEPKPVAKPEPRPPVKTARVAPRPKVKPKRKPPEPDQMQALLKNLAKRKAALEHARNPQPEAKPAPRAAPPQQRLAARSSIDRQVTERRLTALVKQQIAPCWNIPAGAKDAQNMRVGVEIRLNADGSLRGAPEVLDTARMRSDRSFRAVAESAVRALLNPRCSPLKLPYDQYDIWRNITFNFDPSEALGP